MMIPKGTCWLHILAIAAILTACSPQKPGYTVGAAAAVPVIGPRPDTCWNSVPGEAIAHAIYKEDLWEGERDLSATFKCLHHDSSLYLLVRVKDDRPLARAMPVDPMERPYWSVFDYDAVVVNFFDGGPRYLAFGYFSDTLYSNGRQAPGIVARFDSTTDGYTLQLKLPLALFGGQREPELDIRVLDNDGPVEGGLYGGRKTTLSWANTLPMKAGGDKMATGYGRLFLQP